MPPRRTHSARTDDCRWQQGLLREVEELIHEANAAKEVKESASAAPSEDSASAPNDYTLGIYQSIGKWEWRRIVVVEHTDLTPS